MILLIKNGGYAFLVRLDLMCCRFKARIKEHIKKDSKTHIFKH